ncbi:MAG: hypothetical protein ACI4QV_06605, partial [Acutalibacteraceae bacterium]
DVYIASCYSTLPYTLLTVPCTLISYVLISDELSILSFVTGIAAVWTVALIFLSTITVHDYSFGKNLVVGLLTILGIIFILFIALLFVSLGGRMISLVSSIITELSYRP